MFFVVKLGTKSQYSLHFLLEPGGDIHYKIGVQLFVLDVMVHRFGSPVRLFLSIRPFSPDFG